MTPKFRAWTEEGKVMYYDVYPFKDDTLFLSYDEIAFDEVPASDFILMQSTGLKDKNGKEIYEGDIINYKYSRHTSTQFVVKYNEFQATFVVVDNHNDLVYTFRELADYIQLNSLEVIGNIYENKELLGE